MSNSSYSATYGPAVVWGNLLETMEGFKRSLVLWSPLWLSFLGPSSSVWDDCGVGAIGLEDWRDGRWRPSSALTFHRHRWGGVEGAVGGWWGRENCRRGLLCGVNVEVPLISHKQCWLHTPAADFLTAYFLLSFVTLSDCMFWNREGVADCLSTQSLFFSDFVAGFWLTSLSAI